LLPSSAVLTGRHLPEFHIIHGFMSCWSNFEERRLRDRPKALLFAVLSLLWLFPTTGALWILYLNWNVWAKASTLLVAIQTTRLEQWIALLLIVAHAMFALLLVRFARNEPKRHPQNI
jgi:hypothetical protein